MPSITTSTSGGGSLVTVTDASGVLLSITDYNSSGGEVYLNTYVSGALIEQDGFAANGVKTLEVDDSVNGNYSVKEWTASGSPTYGYDYSSTGQELATYTFDPASGAIVFEEQFASGYNVDETFSNGSATTIAYVNSNGNLIHQIGYYPPTITMVGMDTDVTQYQQYINFYDSSGHLTEQEGFQNGTFPTTGTSETSLIYYGSDGSVSSRYFSPGLSYQTYFDTSGNGWANTLNPSNGHLIEQDGFTAGVKTYEADYLSDGSSLIKTFDSSGHLLTVSGFAGYGPLSPETFSNAYDPSSGFLLSQIGFASTGAKAVEIDHAADGSYTVSEFSALGLTGEMFLNSGGVVQETLTRDPPSGAYTLAGTSGGVTLTAIPGFGTLTAGGSNTTFAFSQGFGSATVSNFTPIGVDHDVVRVDTHLAPDYSHLLADAQISSSDVIFDFAGHQQLTLRGVQISQLSSSDFLFV